MFEGQVVAITGASAGIGFAIAQMFTDHGAKVAISDRSAPDESAAKIGVKSYACDVTKEEQVTAFIDNVRADLGSIDIYVSNAGVGFGNGETVCASPNKAWELSWQVNVMGSVYAARKLIPDWAERTSGRFVITASAAGLLAEIRTASYTATKHAAVGLAESIAVTHHADGIKAHCICPQYVESNLTRGQRFAEQSRDGYLQPSDVADALRVAIETDKFLVLPHPVVADYMKHKAHDYDAYLGGLAKLRSKMSEEDLFM